jgi:hypothetical protein
MSQSQFRNTDRRRMVTRCSFDGFIQNNFLSTIIRWDNAHAWTNLLPHRRNTTTLETQRGSKLAIKQKASTGVIKGFQGLTRLEG